MKLFTPSAGLQVPPPGMACLAALLCCGWVAARPVSAQSSLPALSIQDAGAREGNASSVADATRQDVVGRGE